MNGIWIPQLLALVGTLAAAGVAIYQARRTAQAQESASRSEMSVQHRTVSLDEMEKAIKFTGQQLVDLRAESMRQHDQIAHQEVVIHKLELAHEECERDKRRLHWEIDHLRNNGGGLGASK